MDLGSHGTRRHRPGWAGPCLVGRPAARWLAFGRGRVCFGVAREGRGWEGLSPTPNVRTSADAEGLKVSEIYGLNEMTQV